MLAAASKSSAYSRPQYRRDADGESEKISVVVDEEDAVRNEEAARWKIALPARSVCARNNKRILHPLGLLTRCYGFVRATKIPDGALRRRRLVGQATVER
ncbi:unnamed protein product [Aureobasidium pullulans]|nr:unnamed protein product [Aureobasidium pullulans]